MDKLLMDLAVTDQADRLVTCDVRVTKRTQEKATIPLRDFDAQTRFE